MGYLPLSLSLSLSLSLFWCPRVLLGMMNAYAYAYESTEIEGTLTITLTSTAKNGEYSKYASASAYDYAITDTHSLRRKPNLTIIPNFQVSNMKHGFYKLPGACVT